MLYFTYTSNCKVKFLFGDNRSLRFSCVGFGWRIFLLKGEKE